MKIRIKTIINYLLFIIDGNFEFFRNKRKQKLKNLYRVDAYCIENYLLQEKYIIEVCQELNPNLKIDEIRRKLSLVEWQNVVEPLYRKLFICYAIIQKYSIAETTKYKVEKLLENQPNSDTLSNEKVNNRINYLYKEIKTTDKNKYLDKYISKMKKISDKIPFTSYVSGKRYLYIPIKNRIKNNGIYTKSIKDGKFFTLLSEHYDRNFDPKLCELVIKLNDTK